MDELITNPRRTLDYSGDRFLPLNVQALLEAEGGVKEKGTAFGIETFGGRAYPQSPYTRLNELAKQYTELEWRDLTGGQKRRLREEHPDAETAYQDWLKRGAEQEREPAWPASNSKRWIGSSRATLRPGLPIRRG